MVTLKSAVSAKISRMPTPRPPIPCPKLSVSADARALLRITLWAVVSVTEKVASRQALAMPGKKPLTNLPIEPVNSMNDNIRLLVTSGIWRSLR